MSGQCAPDLPFFQTVMWHIKQIAAVGMIAASIVIILILFAVAYGIFTAKGRK